MKKFNMRNLLVFLTITNILSLYFLFKKVTVIEVKVDLISQIVLPEDTTYKATYNKILPKITAFNGQVKPATVKKIAKVMHHYDLDKTDKSTKMFVGQLLQESGVNQNINGKPLVSSGGAIGLAQITPTTALGYLTRIVTATDKKEMVLMGASDFSSLKKTDDKIGFVKRWLKSENNNIVLWGYIMHDLYKRCNNVEKSLVCYNAGIGGMQTYLDSGNVISNHEYVLSIVNKTAN